MKTTTNLQEIIFDRATKQFTMQHIEAVYAFEKAAYSLFGHHLPDEIQNIVDSMHAVNAGEPCHIESLQKSYDAQKEYFIYCFMNRFVNDVVNAKKDD